MNNSKIVEVIKSAKLFLEQGESDTRYRRSKYSFQQGGKISFRTVVLTLLNRIKKTLSLELDNFFNVMNLFTSEGIEDFSVSAFSQARYKLEPIFFESWNRSLKQSYYRVYQSDLKSYKGYYLQGVDGTCVYLPDIVELGDHFGTSGNQVRVRPMAQGMIRYDLLNEFVEEAHLYPIKTSEPAIALEHLWKVPSNVISIYDRIFPSAEFIYEHERMGLKYVMRLKVGFNKEVKSFIESGLQEAIVEFPINSRAAEKMRNRGLEVSSGQKVKVRLVRIELKSGEVEVLATNLMEEEGWDIADLDLLYDHRWGVETFIDLLKNKMGLELFSGQKPKAIYQEFFAAIFTLNLQTILLKDCEEPVVEISVKTKLDYKVNRTISLGLMKNIICLFFLNSTIIELKDLVKTLQNKFIKNLSAVRAGRSYKRKRKSRRINRKHQTDNNYRHL